MKTDDPYVLEFMAAVKGVPGHHVAAALRVMTPGVDWTGCSKSHMASDYASARRGRVTVSKYLATIALSALRAKAIARGDGRPDWKNAS